jgi:hypothetical protein
MNEKSRSYWADSLRDTIEDTDLSVETRDVLITAVTIVDIPAKVVYLAEKKIKEKFSQKDPSLK